MRFIRRAYRRVGVFPGPGGVMIVYTGVPSTGYALRLSAENAAEEGE
ncbi:hypothetical protein [Crossiella cryophila]|uniref:Uncharacterized protein n=1 Tax=Crossiella cryophila TaxID=43355 RepID=A0A7W7CBW1_9PSEU|nr:hypothetical protein [Crossiella cryophila]MBB4678312.1 hypothetical protein [Crossiella cryophila]